MKKLLPFLAFMIFAISAQAQKADDCPAVDWVIQTDLNKDSFRYRDFIIVDDGIIFTGEYFKGAQNVAGLPVPAISLNNIESHKYIIKTDFTGKGEWILPVEVINAPKYGRNENILISNPISSDNGNFSFIITADGVEFNFAGKKKGVINEVHRYRFVVNAKGKVLEDNIYLTDSLSSQFDGFYTLKAKDSSFLFIGTKSLERTTHFIKYDKDYKILWHKIIEGPQSYYDEIHDGQTNISIYGFLKGDDSVNIDGLLLTKSNPNYMALYYSRLDITTGVFSESKVIVEGMRSSSAGVVTSLPSGDVFAAFTVSDTDTVFFPFNGKKFVLNPGFQGNYIKSHTVILKYSPQSLTSSLIVLKSLVQSNSSQAQGLVIPYRLLYLPQSNQLLVAGFYRKEVDFLLDTISSDIQTQYLLSLNPDGVQNSDYAEWATTMESNWLVYFKAQNSANSFGTLSIKYDKDEYVYLMGGASSTSSGKLDFDRLSLLNSSSENVSFCIKLTALTSHIQHDAARMRAAQENAQYQWYDCENGMQAVSGATDRYFTPSNVNGKYAVKVSNTWCSVMSDCQKLSVPLVKDLQAVQIYPNPVSHTLYLSNLPIGVDIAVFDVMGRKIFSSSVQQSNFKINTESWSQGVYLVQLNYQGERWMEKVVK